MSVRVILKGFMWAEDAADEGGGLSDETSPIFLISHLYFREFGVMALS